jgi:uncharacterized protein YjbI with pentapeptide repeats
VITPAIAPVRPRFVSPTTGDALLLEDFVCSTAAQSSRGLIHLDGPAGAGKTTALRHLAATVLPHFPVLFLDDPDPTEASLRGQQTLVVYTRVVPLSDGVSRKIAPWDDDDLIEYLLARHCDQASSLFRRIRDASDRSLARGRPELWRIVIERMARDATIERITDALMLAVDAGCQELGNSELAARHCEQALELADDVTPASKIGRSQKRDESESIPMGCYLWRLMRFPPIRTLITADQLSKHLSSRDRIRLLARQLPRDLVEATANRVKSMPSAMEYLYDLTDYRSLAAPMAASILHATDTDWKPTESSGYLAQAFFGGARWSGIQLADANLRGADLSGADLHRATLTNVRLDEADLQRARLSQSTINSCTFFKADLSGANLRGATGSATTFVKSDLRRADFRGCRLPGAQFSRAQMQEAKFFAANLHSATLIDADILDADFRNVNFTLALLQHLRLRHALIEGAVFTRARLQDCDLENIHWDDARFDGALLSRAYLTGSILHYANFRDADLRHAGLGDIDWEGADLRGADLTGCSFHMGSTRCGLVDSPYPSEGTRTGFYTDDYDDRYFKPPEEIRKASLQGANLLGANVEGVDFYLVDLRDAIYDDSQRHHFSRSGAILHDTDLH